MKIPYGVSSFRLLRQGGYLYVDKTHFIATLEDFGAPYLLFLRPRRFGKSLFVSVLEHYYDIARADEFDDLFGGLWIHDNPTPERNQYLILSFDFSLLSTDGGPDALRRTFFGTIKISVLDCLRRYSSRIEDFSAMISSLDSFQDAETMLRSLFGLVRDAGHKLYVLIDEYDNFANRLLADNAQDIYESAAKRSGFVRTFYAALKAGTGIGAVARMFVTGVAPLLLDDLSSGFNIASHASQHPDLNTLTGFTRAELERALDQVLEARPELVANPEIGDRARLLGVLEQYYNGYRFSPDASERVFNSDMVLYFLDSLATTGRAPHDMLDLNVRTDYRSLQRIGTMTGTAQIERRALLESILGEGGFETELKRQFGLGNLSSQDNFVSFLYYLGMLTLSDQPSTPERRRLEIPNRVIRELQWEHLAVMLNEQEHLDLDALELRAPLKVMADQGDIGPFLQLFHERVVQAIGLKDLRRFDEKSLKLMLLAFISLSHFYHPLSEKEFAQGYCDLFLGVSPLYAGASFAWLLELKYLPSGASDAQIDAAFADAFEQVERYANDERLVPLLTRGQGLKSGALVFVGAQKVVFRPWPLDAGPSLTVGREKAARPRATKPSATKPRAAKSRTTESRAAKPRATKSRAAKAATKPRTAKKTVPRARKAAPRKAKRATSRRS